MRTRLGGLLALACLAALVVVTPGRAPGPPALVPVEYDYVPPAATKVAGGEGVLVDETHAQVFVAQRNKGLLVTDLDGVPTRTLAMPGRQTHLRLSEDGNAIYVVAHDVFGTDRATGSSILRVDTTSLAVSVLVESAFEPNCLFGPIEPLADRLWYGTSCSFSTGRGSFGYVDPGDGTVVDVDVRDSDIDGILAVPGRDDRLILMAGSSLRLLAVNDVEPVTVTSLASHSDVYSSGVAAVTPDGAEVVVADGGGARRYSTEDLDPLGAFAAMEEPSAIAVRADGTVAVGSGGGPGLRVFEPDATRPFRIYQLDGRSGPGGGVVYRGLAWGTERVYAIAEDGRFFAFVPRRRAHIELALERRHYRFGDEIPIKISLDGPPPGSSVVLWSVDRHEVRRRLKEIQIPARGALETAVIARRNGYFEATFAGNESFDPTRDVTSDVYVSAKVMTRIRSGRSSGGVRVHRLNETVLIRGRVLPNHARDCLVFSVDVLVERRWRESLDRCVRLRPDSTAVLGLRGSREVAGYKFRVRGIFRGDRDNWSAHGSYDYFKFTR